MAEKPDFYEVLGVGKEAPVDEIKRAYKKIVLACHQDSVTNKARKEGKSEEQIKAAVDTAAKKLNLATEANDVLTDTTKRSIYDRSGHAGLETLSSQPSSSGPTFEELAQHKPKVYNEDDTMTYFDKIKERRPETGLRPNSDGLTSEERRAKAREERLAKRKAAAAERTEDPEPVRKPQPSSGSSTSEAFKEAAENVRQTTAQLKEGQAIVDVAVLENFLPALDALREEVSNAIKRSKSGPKP